MKNTCTYVTVSSAVDSESKWWQVSFLIDSPAQAPIIVSAGENVPK